MRFPGAGRGVGADSGRRNRLRIAVWWYATRFLAMVGSLVVAICMDVCHAETDSARLTLKERWRERRVRYFGFPDDCDPICFKAWRWTWVGRQNLRMKATVPLGTVDGGSFDSDTFVGLQLGPTTFAGTLGDDKNYRVAKRRARLLGPRGGIRLKWDSNFVSLELREAGYFDLAPEGTPEDPPPAEYVIPARLEVGGVCAHFEVRIVQSVSPHRGVRVGEGVEVGEPADREAPEIVLASDSLEGTGITAEVGVKILIEGDVNDDRQLGTVRYSLNGSPDGALPLVSTFSSACFGSSGHFSLEITPQVGSNTLTLVAGDQAGNSAAKEVSFAFRETAPLSDVVSVSVSGTHMIALKGDGTVWTCGSNRYGQLGDGTFIDRASPVQVGALEGVVAVAANFSQSLALTADGNVWPWGFGSDPPDKYIVSHSSTNPPYFGVATSICGNGNLRAVFSGTGNQYSFWNWVPSFGETYAWVIEWSEIEIRRYSSVASGGQHGLALRGDGVIRSWGDNGSGQLGDGTYDSAWGLRSVLQETGEVLSGVVAVAAGSNHSIAVRYDGTVWSWGGNSRGQVGDGTTDSRPRAVRVGGLTDVVGISASGDQSFALRNDGRVWAWGANDRGVLGDGTTIDRNVPVQVQGISDVAMVAAGPVSTIAVKGDGSVWGWGSNESRQLGGGTYAPSSSLEPMMVK